MQLRRFTAESTPAALDAVRMSLGEEAIILANRRHGDLVEIIATGQIDDPATLAEMSIDGIEEALDQSAKEILSVSPSLEKNEPILESGSPESIDAQRRFVPEPSEDMANDTVEISELSQAIAEDAKSTSPLSPLLGANEVRDLDHLDSVNTKAIGSTEKDNAVKEAEDTVYQESQNGLEQSEQILTALNAQNELLEAQFKSLEVNLWGANSPTRSKHLQHLMNLGLGAEIAVRLVERAETNVSLDVALRQSYALLKSTLPIVTDKTLTNHGVTVMSGAPGSGKTTALIKLATEHVKKEGNQSIVIVCADTRRIGAFEELQAYGRLLGVPTVHAHDTHELDSLVDAFKHKKLVLVDHSLPGDAEAIELPMCLNNPRDEDSVRHLFALPATTQSATVEDLIAKHCQKSNIKCVLTHLDSNSRLGGLFSAIIRHNLPIAYWSDSASVQKPLQKADASVLVATAVAMSRRIESTSDDIWLQRLIQPSRSSFTDTNLSIQDAAVESL